jgi:hypothetical protein
MQYNDNMGQIEHSEFQLLKDSVKGDERGRIGLGEIVKDRQFRVLKNDQGELLLIPVVTIPEREAWVFNNPKVKKLIDEGLRQSAAGETKSLGSFAQYADSNTGEDE